MQNTYISIEPNSLMTYGEEIINIATAYNNEIQNIYNIVENLKGVWDGTSAQKFADKIESHKSEYEAFGKLINQVGEFLITAGSEYKNLEENL